MPQFTSDSPTQVYASLEGIERLDVLPAHLQFSDALAYLKRGSAVTRTGWDRKGAYLFLVPGSTFKVSEGRPMAQHFDVGTEVQYQPHIDLFTAHEGVVPWLASQADLLANDWVVLPNGVKTP